MYFRLILSLAEFAGAAFFLSEHCLPLNPNSFEFALIDYCYPVKPNLWELMLGTCLLSNGIFDLFTAIGKDPLNIANIVLEKIIHTAKATVNATHFLNSPPSQPPRLPVMQNNRNSNKEEENSDNNNRSNENTNNNIANQNNPF